MWQRLWEDMLPEALAFGVIALAMYAAMGGAILVGRWRRKSGSRWGRASHDSIHDTDHINRP